MFKRKTRKMYLHEVAKKFARKFLKAKYKFSDDQITEEKWVRIGDKKYRVDVVAESPNFRVAVECGKVGLSKVGDLRKRFDLVLCIRRYAIKKPLIINGLREIPPNVVFHKDIEDYHKKRWMENYARMFEGKIIWV